MLKVDVPCRDDSASFSSGASSYPAASLPRLKDWDASMSVAVRAARWVAVRGALLSLCDSHWGGGQVGVSLLLLSRGVIALVGALFHFRVGCCVVLEGREGDRGGLLRHDRKGLCVCGEALFQDDGYRVSVG